MPCDKVVRKEILTKLGGLEVSQSGEANLQAVGKRKLAGLVKVNRQE
jgi:acyl CoA:acetate/3-ketoacid CoA transferase beta subunit